MDRTTIDTPSINANFATTVINRAADIINAADTTAGEVCNAFPALQQAGDEVIASESHNQKTSRTYGWPRLMNDLRDYITGLHPEHAGSFGPVSDWSSTTDPSVVAQTLRTAALQIARQVEERTRTADRFETMTPKAQSEDFLMRKAASFLTENSLDVKIEWDREDPNAPIDYRGTVDGAPWAFELTQLRKDAKGSHRQIGHPEDKRSVEQQLKDLGDPIPRQPDGPEELNQALKKAIEDKSKKSKLDTLNGSRHCLIIHNWQFLYTPDWDGIEPPDLSKFDAVMILHQESMPPAHVWEILKQDGFGRTLPSQDMNDLADITESQIADGEMRAKTELIKSTWKHVESLGLTDDDIREAVDQARKE